MTARPHQASVARAESSTADAVEPEAILERAARGDRSALLELYDRYAPALMAVAYRITGARAEAEDVVQDAMLRAWRDAGSFDRSRGSATSWLMTMTRNRAIDVLRARKRRDVHAANEGPDDAIVATPELAVSTAERAAAVRLALDSLSEDQRAVLDLAYFSGLSHSEIAERLGEPLGTVKTRIASAVRRLRDELARFSPADGRAS
jgi:RNA polymerase sigma-70 factor (ECF subfamily)